MYNAWYLAAVYDNLERSYNVFLRKRLLFHKPDLLIDAVLVEQEAKVLLCPVNIVEHH